jgi:hypothetical protein
MSVAKKLRKHNTLSVMCHNVQSEQRNIESNEPKLKVIKWAVLLI